MAFESNYKPKTRFTMDVGSDFDARLSQIADQEGTSKAEIIKRAVASYSYLKEETQHGRQVTITDQRTGQAIKDVVLP